MKNVTSCIFHNDAFDHVRDILALIDRDLDPIVDLFPFDHHQDVRIRGIEQVGQSLSEALVAVILELMDADEGFGHIRTLTAVPQLPYSLGRHFRYLYEDIDQRLEIGSWFVQSV